DTDPMLGNASPRKPKVAIRNRSSSFWSLLVECLSTASARSSAAMPSPLSLTRISAVPLFSTQTEISVALASSEFSISSFTTDAGRYHFAGGNAARHLFGQNSYLHKSKTVGK